MPSSARRGPAPSAAPRRRPRWCWDRRRWRRRWRRSPASKRSSPVTASTVARRGRRHRRPGRRRRRRPPRRRPRRRPGPGRGLPAGARRPARRPRPAAGVGVRAVRGRRGRQPRSTATRHGRFHVLAVVFPAGTSSGVHFHGCWGLIGYLRGGDEETRFAPTPSAGGGVELTEVSRHVWRQGDITALLPPDDGWHRVRNPGPETGVSVHVLCMTPAEHPHQWWRRDDGQVFPFPFEEVAPGRWIARIAGSRSRRNSARLALPLASSCRVGVGGRRSTRRTRKPSSTVATASRSVRSPGSRVAPGG